MAMVDRDFVSYEEENGFGADGILSAPFSSLNMEESLLRDDGEYDGNGEGYKDKEEEEEREGGEREREREKGREDPPEIVSSLLRKKASSLTRAQTSVGLVKKKANPPSSSSSALRSSLPSSPSRTFLRSSSSNAIARNSSSSAVLKPQPPSVKRRNSIGGIGVGVGAGGSSVAPPHIDTPPPQTPSRRNSLSNTTPRHTPSISSSDSRRASLSSFSSRSPLEVPKWASSSPLNLSSSFRSPSSSSSRMTTSMNQPPRSFSKTSETTTTTTSRRQPSPSPQKAPSLSSKPSPKPTVSRSPSSISSSPATHIKPSPSPSSGTFRNQKKPSPTLTPASSSGLRRSINSLDGSPSGISPRHASPSGISPRQSSATSRRLPSPFSSERSAPGGGAARRKSITPDIREPRSTPTPQVEAKAGDDLRLDLRGHKVRSLDGHGVNLSPKLEFVYLRDNKLSTLNGIDILRRVKVLDLSFNEFKGGGFEPLANCKMLQQLYLAGNQITSLSGLPELPNLEFLSVAQNKLKSLAMASQPKLQVLAASKNKISTLKGFPHLPALENLRLEENPISEMPHVEAASIILVGPTLKKFNDRDLVLEEQELACRYPSHTALCIRDGWDFCDVEDAAESTLKFLVAQWSDKLPPGHAVGNASVDHPFEEDPCSCYFSFVKKIDAHEDAGLALRYQWFIGDKTPTNFMPIEGAQGEIYWPKHEDVGCCLKVECTAILNEIEYGPIFTISAPVSQGTGCPKVLDLVVEGDFIEGVVIQGRAKVAWCGGTPGKGIVSWLRRHENCSPVPINGADENEYELTFDDVGATLLLMYTPVTAEGVRGEAHFATTSTVQPAPPRVSNVHVVGSPVEGSSIEGVGKYFGGKEGPSKYEWLREDPISGEFKLVSRGTATYILSEEDVGLRMMFIYTPVNSDGHHGDPASAITIAVQQAPPKVTQLRIVGDVREGNKVAVSAIVNGGVEGASRVQWFKTTTPDASLGDSNLEAISTSKIAKAFRIPLGAVGFYLVAKYTPVRSDGESGEPAIVFSDTKVEMLPPSLNFLSITGEFIEGETLTATYGYIGGHEGSSLYSWYMHESENDVGVAIAESEGLLQLQLSKAAVNKLISFRCTPVRDDGVSGETRSTMGQECVRPGSPKLLSLQILGEPVEGNRLMVDTVYWGGEEGASELQWFLTRPDGAQREIKGACNSQYTVRSEDIEGLLCVSCEPVRIDGARGPVAISQPIGPALPAPPTCESLELCGQLVEGGRLSFKMIYKGGEKGSCLHKWFRQSASSKVHLSSSETLDLTPDDIGSRIELVFTPVRKDGFSGTPQRVVSDVVKDAEPLGISLILPDCYEDVEAVPQKVYFGGCEGVSSYTWFQLEEKLEGPEIPEYADFLSDSITYTPTLGDVGKYLLLKWTPTRNDGERGRPLLACSDFPVAPAFPSVKMVTVKEDSAGVYVGEGQYYGGIEGQSKLTWYREPSDGAVTPIPGATSKTYMVDDDDYTCRLIFGYVPVRQDGVVGQLVLSEPTEIIYPEMPRVQKLVLTGKAVEGEVLTALEVLPKSEKQQKIWDNYKKSVRYQWSRSKKPGVADAFDPLPLQRACSYKLRSEDIGFCMRCDCIVTDVFGRSMEPVSASTPSVAPGMPKVDKLEIEGLGYHTNLYAVRGIYSGGKEGKSMIQWFRAMAGSPDLIPIPGEIGRMYEANVDDVGYRLVAVYTPVREDNVEGTPVSASTEPIAVEPEVAKEVKQRLEIGAVKFEALRDRDRSPMKVQQQQGLGSLERRILDVNRKRLKVVKPGSKTSFPNTEIRGSYAPPFHVELFRNDQHRMKIVIDSENEVDLMVQTRHIRDVIVLVLRGFAQRFNSTPLNLLLKM